MFNKELYEALKLEELEFEIVDYAEARLLGEMARIGYLDSYEIYVRTDDPGKIPHMHIWDRSTKGQKFHTCIRLDKAEYFHHTGKEDKLNSTERKKLVEFLSENNADFDMTNWKYLLIQWNQNNSDVVIDKDSKMPDYRKLR